MPYDLPGIYMKALQTSAALDEMKSRRQKASLADEMDNFWKSQGGEVEDRLEGMLNRFGGRFTPEQQLAIAERVRKIRADKEARTAASKFAETEAAAMYPGATIADVEGATGPTIDAARSMEAIEAGRAPMRETTQRAIELAPDKYLQQKFEAMYPAGKKAELPRQLINGTLYEKDPSKGWIPVVVGPSKASTGGRSGQERQIENILAMEYGDLYQTDPNAPEIVQRRGELTVENRDRFLKGVPVQEAKWAQRMRDMMENPDQYDEAEFAALERRLQRSGKEFVKVPTAEGVDKWVLSDLNTGEVTEIMRGELPDVPEAARSEAGKREAQTAKSRIALKTISKTVKPEYFNYFQQGQLWLSRPLDKALGDAKSDEERKLIRKTFAFKGTVDRAFDAYRRTITGAAAAEAELERLKENYLNLGMSYDQFIGALSSIQKMAEAEMEIDRMTRSGISVDEATIERLSDAVAQAQSELEAMYTAESPAMPQVLSPKPTAEKVVRGVKERGEKAIETMDDIDALIGD